MWAYYNRFCPYLAWGRCNLASEKRRDAEARAREMQQSTCRDRTSPVLFAEKPRKPNYQRLPPSDHVNSDLGNGLNKKPFSFSFAPFSTPTITNQSFTRNRFLGFSLFLCCPLLFLSNSNRKLSVSFPGKKPHSFS